jgi:hypothetical protein
VLLASNDATGNVALLDANGNLLAGPQVRLAGSISVAAANSNGIEFAIDVTAGGSAQVLLLDAQLNLQAAYATAGAAGLVFSPMANRSTWTSRTETRAILSASGLVKSGHFSAGFAALDGARLHAWRKGSYGYAD